MGAVRRTLHRTVTCLGLVVLAAATSRAQAAPPETPETVATHFLETLTAGDYAANAAMMHPSALATIRRFVVALSARDPSGAALQQMVGVSSSAALDSLSDAQVYARFLHAMLGTKPDLDSMMRASTFTVIGHVNEGATLTHVVYRLTMQAEGIAIRKVDVLTLQRDGDAWRPTLTTDIENLISRFSGS